MSLLKIIPSQVMSLLGVHSTPIPPMFSSFCTSHTTPATSPALSTGIRFDPCATPLGDELSGRLAGPHVMLERRMDDHWNIEGTETYQIRGRDSHDSPHWTKNLQMVKHGPGGG